MTLKRQLLIACLLMLLIPWAGLQFVLELDQALRQQAASQLERQTERLAGIIRRQPEAQLPLQPLPTRILYADALSRPLYLDGYGDDWPTWSEETDSAYTSPVTATEPVQWQAAVDRQNLYLLIRVRQPPGRYFDPGRPEEPHAHLRLYLTLDGQRHTREIRTPAPGPVVAQAKGTSGSSDFRVNGVWQATGQGYQVELRMPRPALNAPVGFEVWHPDTGKSGGYSVLGGMGYDGSKHLPHLIHPISALEAELQPLLAAGQRALVLHDNGWVLADGATPIAASETDFDQLGPWQIVEQIALNGLRAVLRRFQPDPTPLPEDASRYALNTIPKTGLVRHGDDESALVVRTTVKSRGTVPVTLVMEQSLNDILALSGDTLGRVIVRSAFFVGLLVLILLGYASWLSWRIARLQRNVAASFDGDGRLVQRMPASTAQDELGELSRQFSHLVDNLQGYTDYLESFARRLSHELKTPVAVVRSSLENLKHDTPDVAESPYITRAFQATDRLSQILQGMSEAARLEKSFDQVEPEIFDLADVAGQATAAYQSLDPEHEIHYVGPSAGCMMSGSPELIVQLLDKLVDNARDFTPKGEAIEVRLEDQGVYWRLQVYNAGPPLPEHLASEIFNSFVSLRERPQEGHLGQGLQIVRLITAYHRGQVHARNVLNPAGVMFDVMLPRQSPTHKK
ncbi:histidine kinase [Marinobacter nanhaiticus D15-8W]|uniref:histidine kinase n=1 Tax=Marinobacter nanhaiticus D15-8W TaxID=626887 RepID=N6W5L1_9GAMM|nr:histidine kinase [Marinobacter nanhaiticus D15-8W]